MLSATVPSLIFLASSNGFTHINLTYAIRSYAPLPPVPWAATLLSTILGSAALATLISAIFNWSKRSSRRSYSQLFSVPLPSVFSLCWTQLLYLILRYSGTLTSLCSTYRALSAAVRGYSTKRTQDCPATCIRRVRATFPSNVTRPSSKTRDAFQNEHFVPHRKDFKTANSMISCNIKKKTNLHFCEPSATHKILPRRYCTVEWPHARQRSPQQRCPNTWARHTNTSQRVQSHD